MMRLRLTGDDKRKMMDLVREMGDIIARNNDAGLELDFSFWAEINFNIPIEDQVVSPNRKMVPTPQ